MAGNQSVVQRTTVWAGGHAGLRLAAGRARPRVDHRGRALAAVVLIAAGTWFVGAYPATAEAAVSQLLAVAGLVLGAFNILKSTKIGGISVLDWAGIVTPGGVTLRASGDGKHKA